MTSRLLPFLLLGGSFTTASAQSILDDDIRWYIRNLGDVSVEDEYFDYRIGGEVTVAGETFRDVEVGSEATGGNYASAGFALREDGEGRVFAHQNDTTGLLFDFSAEPGDTLSVIGLFHEPFRYRVAAARDTAFGDGVRRRLLVIEDVEGSFASEGTVVVEGIGYFRGDPFAEPTVATISYPSLTCVFAGGQRIIDNSRDGRCFVSGLREARAAAPGEAYPSPFADYLTLDFAEAGGERYELFDARGTRLRMGVLPKGALRVPTADLPAGVYVAVVGLRDGTHVVQRLTKAQ